MPNSDISLEYEGLRVSGTHVATLGYMHCCGIRELQNFQENQIDLENFQEELWDWYDDLDEATRAEYNFTCEQTLLLFNQIQGKFLELFPDRSPNQSIALEKMCYALSTIGETWTPPTSITILALVENFDNAYPIMDALVEGGWQLSVDTVLNTNSGNDISLWTYRRKETV